jgi:hypothetical protein
MSSRLRHVWFSGAMTRLARLGWPKGAETRRRPCMVCVGDRCEVGYYKGKVLIALVLVLNVTLLAIICVVACIYSK